MRRTKIVCTLGPACSDLAILRAMVRAGMDVARVNFSHGNRAEHARYVELVRSAAQQEGRVVAVLEDIQGPKVRVGELREPLELQRGARVRLAPANQARGDAIPVSHAGLARDVAPGGTLLLDDGLLELRVLGTEGPEVLAEVVVGGTLRSHKSVNAPGARFRIAGLSGKDLEDIRFGVKLEVDYIAASFVRGQRDVERVRELVAREELPIRVVAKIETAEALENIDPILGVSDGVLVARGDLGAELPPEEVPLLQKDLIRRSNLAGLPVITATQMLESMVHHPRPTRAEASDVANAVLDGTDAVMLSGETAVGQHPVRAVEVMDRIVRKAEEAAFERFHMRGRGLARPTVADAIAHAAATTAEQLGACAIVALTNSGGTARYVSKYRPRTPILGVTPIERTAGQLALMWGVVPLLVPRHASEEGLILASLDAARARGLVRAGERVVVTSGKPGVTGTTDRLRVHVVPEPGDAGEPLAG